jgi:uncharacterized protein (TIGR02679 family)
VSRLDDPALGRLWEALAERLQRNGLAPRGTVTLDALSRDERFALAGLVGRRVGERARLDLAALDARLRDSGAAPGLVAAVSAQRGPLVDRPRVRSAALASRNAVWSTARETLAAQELTGQAWVEPWLESVRPVVARVPPPRATALMVAAVRCVALLCSHGPRRGRAELAFAVAGNSHALDDGSVLGAVVLRAIAARASTPLPSSAGERRQLWAQAGVLSDEVSTTVLTFGLRPVGSSPAAVAIRRRSDAGCESHLTLRDLSRTSGLVPEGVVVWACENPRVLEAAMDAGSRAVIVCTAGNPTVVATTLLGRLVSDGAALRYRGDFDWPGLAIANRVIEAFGATPWRMRSEDYKEALRTAGPEGMALEGEPLDARWDLSLMPAMVRGGVAIHEEAMLDLLIGDLLEP